MESFIYFISWVLIPIIPAYFCYKVLKSQNESTTVGGTLFGLKIESTGAFAMYFVLFLCIHYFFGTRLLASIENETKFSHQTNKMWVVKCKLNLYQSDNKTLLSDDDAAISLKQFKFDVSPPLNSEKDNGEVIFYIPQELLNVSTGTVAMEVQGFTYKYLTTSEIYSHKKNKDTIDLGQLRIRKTIYPASYDPK